MIALTWNVSTAIRGYLRYYMPSNIVLNLLRTPRGLKWGTPAALALVPAYLLAAGLAAAAVERGGPGWLNVLVLVFLWNAMKFAAMGLWSLVLLVRLAVGALASSRSRLLRV